MPGNILYPSKYGTRNEYTRALKGPTGKSYHCIKQVLGDDAGIMGSAYLARLRN